VREGREKEGEREEGNLPQLKQIASSHSCLHCHCHSPLGLVVSPCDHSERSVSLLHRLGAEEDEEGAHERDLCLQKKQCLGCTDRRLHGDAVSLSLFGSASRVRRGRATRRVGDRGGMRRERYLCLLSIPLHLALNAIVL
jgi:hypothetical protein